MCRYVFPWTIWRVPYLSSNQKLLQMQKDTHVLMQKKNTGSPPYIPYNAPHACKQVLNSCPIETMHIVVFLLELRQSLSADKGPYHMEAGAQKRAEVLRNPCILGGPQTKRDEIRIGCLTPTFSGAQKRAEYSSAEFHQWGVGGGVGVGFLVFNNS